MGRVSHPAAAQLDAEQQAGDRADPEYIGKYTTNYPLLAPRVLALLPPALVAAVLNRHIRGC